MLGPFRAQRERSTSWNNHERTRKSRKGEFKTPIFFRALSSFSWFSSPLFWFNTGTASARAVGRFTTSVPVARVRRSVSFIDVCLRSPVSSWIHWSEERKRRGGQQLCVPPGGLRSRVHPSRSRTCLRRDRPARPELRPRHYISDLLRRCAGAERQVGAWDRHAHLGQPSSLGDCSCVYANKRPGPISTTIFGHPARPRMSA
jgi:hypothetical protein